jgi:hypothetical protein
LVLWRIAYWTLMAAFIATAALNMGHVRGGFLTNHLADLVVPALLYVVVRGLAEREPRQTLLRKTVGATPETAAVILFLASAATEFSQIYWPKGIFSGRFDPVDLAAYAVGLGVCYICDRRGKNAQI